MRCCATSIAAKLPRPELARWGPDEYLVYHPNAPSGGREAAPDPERTAHSRIDLSAASGTFRADRLRAEDGGVPSGAQAKAGAVREFTAPWKGCDVVWHLRR
jgi:hypothetical protein